MLKKILSFFLAFVLSGMLNITLSAASVYEDVMSLRATAANTAIGDVFHDQGYVYISDIEPSVNEDVTIRLRTEKYNVTSAVLEYSNNSGNSWYSVTMSKDSNDDTGYYEYWKAVIPAQSSSFYYRFSVNNDSDSVYLGSRGKSEKPPYYSNCFYVIPGMETPDWAKGAYWYLINPDGFYNSNIQNDLSTTGTSKVIPWNADTQGLTERYGGDLAGITQKTEYLKELGVDAVYMNPIWDTTNNLCYGPISYYKISPFLGTDKDLVDLSNALHTNGIKITLDAVFSYIQRDGVWFNRGNYNPLTGVSQSAEHELTQAFDFITWPDEYESVWGNPRVNLSNQRIKELFFGGNDSVIKRYLNQPYDIDGWRFDAVNSFFTGEETLEQVSSQIRDSIKGINSEAIMIAEDHTREILSGNAWDTSYGIRGYFRKWFGGEYSQSVFVNNLYDYMALARTKALCNINLYDLHDEARITSDTLKDASKLKALQIFQMTFLGSPATYYGDEIGITSNAENGLGEQKWNAFNWDESEWDIQLLNTQKALSQLRKKYSALKTGAIKIGSCDDSQQVLDFGRFDENGSVISVTNQSDNVYNKTIDVKQYNVCDGQILTDYLTGNTYKVENGCVELDVLPGGNILVTNGEISPYRGIFEVTDISANGTVIQKSADSFKLSGNGSFSLKGDSFQFLSAPIYGSGALNADISEVNNGALLIREDMTDLSAFYGVEINGSVVSVWCRNKAESDLQRLTQITLSDNCSVKLRRTGQNRFSAYYGVSNNGTVSQWLEIPKSACYISMGEKAYYGMVSLEEENLFTSVSAYPIEDSRYIDFDSEVGSAYFEANNALECTDGALVVESKTDTNILSRIPRNDYTVKAEISGELINEKDYMAVVAQADEKNFVFAARIINNGENCIALGKSINGEMVITDYTEDIKPHSSCILQLQKSGAYYTVAYSYDGKLWNSLNEEIFANYSYEKAGVKIGAGISALINYVSFGDSINDKTTVSAPVYTNKTVVDYSGFAANTIRPSYSIYGSENEWYYTNGGIARKEASGISQLTVNNRKFSDFRVSAILDPLSSTSAVGITMLRSSVDNSLGSGYILSLKADGGITLSYNGKTLFTRQIQLPDGGLPVRVERIDSDMWIYAGYDETLIYKVNDVTASQGYITYFVRNGAGGIYNDSVCSGVTDWTDFSGVYSSHFTGNGTTVTSKTEERAIANLTGKGFTDVMVSATLSLNTADSSKDSYIGFVLGGEQNVLPEKTDGLSILLNSDGSISVMRKNTVIASTAAVSGRTEVDLKAIKKDRKLYVFVNGKREESLCIETGITNGGILGITSCNSTGTFSKLVVNDFTNYSVEPEFSETDDRDYTNGMTVNTGNYSSQNGVFSAVGGYNSVLFKTSLTSQAYCMSLDAMSDGDYIEIPYRTNGVYSLSIRIYPNSSVVVKNGGSVTNWISFGQKIDFTQKNNYTIYSDENSVKLWINGASAGEFVYSANVEEFKTAFTGISFSLKLHQTAKAENVVIWSEKSAITTCPLYDESDVIYSNNMTVEEGSYQSGKQYNSLKQTLLFETGLSESEKYVMSMNVSTDSGYFDIPFRSDKTDTVYLRFTSVGFAVYKNEKAISSTYSYEALGMGTLNLSDSNRFTVSVSKESFGLWINGIPAVGINEEEFCPEDYAFPRPGVVLPLNVDDKAVISDVKIWASRYTDFEDTKPEYNSYTDCYFDAQNATLFEELSLSAKISNGEELILRNNGIEALTLKFQEGTATLFYNTESIASLSHASLGNASNITVRVNSQRLYIWLGGERIGVFELDSLYQDILFNPEISGENNSLVCWGDNKARYVSFNNKNGQLIESIKVISGSDVTSLAPEIPQERGYMFKGWDADLSCVTEDIVTKPLFDRTDEPIYIDGSHKHYSNGVYSGTEIITEASNSIKLSSSNVSLMPVTGLSENDTYYMSFTFSEITADCVNIAYLSNGSSYISFRLYKNQYVIVNKAGNATYSDWVSLSKSGIGVLDLSAENTVTLKASKGVLEIWINGIKVKDFKYKDSFDSSVYSIPSPGVYVYSGSSGKIDDFTVWTEPKVEKNTRPVYLKKADDIYVRGNGNNVILTDISSSKKTIYYAENMTDFSSYCLCFEVTPSSDTQFFEIACRTDGENELVARIYKNQCLMLKNGKEFSNWAQFAQTGLGYLYSSWGQKLYVTLRSEKDSFGLWINGQKVNNIVFKEELAGLGLENAKVGFSAYLGESISFENIKLWKENSKVCKITYHSELDESFEQSCYLDEYYLLKEIPLVEGYASLGWLSHTDGKIYSQGTRFTALSNAEYTAKYIKLGDADYNGIVNSADLVLIKKKLFSIECELWENGADANEDTVIDIRDLVRVKKIISKVGGET